MSSCNVTMLLNNVGVSFLEKRIYPEFIEIQHLFS